MPRFALPTCPQCHGAGEIETWVEYPTHASVSWEPCPCTYSPLPDALEREEDWTRP